jgi:hypothetical protein
MLEEVFHKNKFKGLIIVIVAALAIISFWRGVWGLMDIYLLPNNHSLSLIISVLIGLILLIIIKLIIKKKK